MQILSFERLPITEDLDGLLSSPACLQHLGPVILFCSPSQIPPSGVKPIPGQVGSSHSVLGLLSH